MEPSEPIPREEHAVGVRRLKAPCELALDEPQLFDLPAAVKPMAALAALGRDEAVAVLPVANGRGGDVDEALDGTDAVDGMVVRWQVPQA
jgi:hypothetical protein